MRTTMTAPPSTDAHLSYSACTRPCDRPFHTNRFLRLTRLWCERLHHRAQRTFRISVRMTDSLYNPPAPLSTFPPSALSLARPSRTARCDGQERLVIAYLVQPDVRGHERIIGNRRPHIQAVRPSHVSAWRPSPHPGRRPPQPSSPAYRSRRRPFPRRA